MLTNTLKRRAHAVGISVAFRSLLVVASACSKDTTAPPPPSTFSVTTGASQTGTVNTALPLPIVVTVVDANGKPLAGIGVSFVPASGSGSVSAAEVSTDANGNAEVSWTLGTVAGADSMEITAGSLAPTTVVATATAAAGISIVGGTDEVVATILAESAAGDRNVRRRRDVAH
jgi:hypothetical protein